MTNELPHAAIHQDSLDDATHAQGGWALLDRLWRGLIDVRLLLGVLLFTVALALIALALPQLPDPLRTDPGEANRWLLATTERLAPLGEALRSIGLLDLLHSPIFQLALAFLGLLILLQAGYAAGAALQLRQIARHGAEWPGTLGAALALPPGRSVYRLRHLLHDQPDQTQKNASDTDAGSADPDAATQIDDALVSCLTPLYARRQHAIASVDAPDLADVADKRAAHEEVRLLALRRTWAALLKPLLAVGLLLCIAGLWLLTRHGWELVVPVLTPGETYRYVAGDLELHYDMPINDAAGQAKPTLTINVGQAQYRLSLAPGAVARVGGVTVQVQPTAPALFVRARGNQSLLAQPGQSTPATAMGLAFAGAGSEQALLLPRLGAGLRIIRSGDGSDTFLVEFYPRNAAAPNPPIIVADDRPETLILEDGEVLDLLPVASIRVSARRMPGTWLFPPALLLILAGSVGYWLRPGFALLQQAPWGRTKRVFIAQSDRRGTIAALRAELEKGGDEHA